MRLGDGAAVVGRAVTVAAVGATDGVDTPVHQLGSPAAISQKLLMKL